MGGETGGGMGGMSGGGMGGSMFGGGMPNNPAPSLGTSSRSGSPALLLHLPMRHPGRRMLDCGAGLAPLELVSPRCAVLLFRRAEPGSVK